MNKAEGLSRRELLGRAALTAAAFWIPTFRAGPAHAAASSVPPNFPPGIALYQQAWENWANEIKVDALWTCTAATPADVVTLANWAHANGYVLRPRGKMHSWAPLTVPAGTSAATRVVLIDPTVNLTAMKMVSPAPGVAAVTVGTGATMDALLTFLEQSGHGLNSVPAPGDVTIGGALAIDGHGTGIPAVGETPTPGHTYGTLSNLVLSFSAVVWEAARGAYALKTFDRSNPQAKAFLTHLGRAFLTEVTLQVGPNHNLRCVSHTDIPATELFAPAGSAGRTLFSMIDASGRVEAIWFPCTTLPWVKSWSICPQKPLVSREVTSPYNYAFADNVPTDVSNLATQILAGNQGGVPLFGNTMYAGTVAGLTATQTYDIWGASKNLLLYVKPTTLRGTANGFSVITSRANIQRVVNEWVEKYLSLVNAYQANGQYPFDMPVEIRVTGLDRAADVQVAGASSPSLSAASPRPDHPEWDVVVWFNILSLVGTGTSAEAYRAIEQWALSNYTGSYAALRPEWSKGWAYGAGTGAWSDQTMLGTTIPNEYRAGRTAHESWDWATETLEHYDPSRVFTNSFLNTLMP